VYQKGIYSFAIKMFSNLLPSITNLTSAGAINWQLWWAKTRYQWTNEILRD